MKTYSDKSGAVRGAKRSGLVDFEVHQTEEGRWYFEEKAAAPVEEYPIIENSMDEFLKEAKELFMAGTVPLVRALDRVRNKYGLDVTLSEMEKLYAESIVR